ncbi:MAG TPA: tetratricopeptide repeat protein, partial [Nitrospirota bacterium]|nr:tetratricopeptide repeat protein [Nitrospirota bacterium]
MILFSIYFCGPRKRRIFLQAGPFFFALLAFSGCSAAPSTDRTGPDAEFRAASLLRSQGLFDSSIVHFRTAAALFRAHRQDRAYIQSQNGIADNLIRKSRFGEAESLLIGLERQSFNLADRDSLAFQETFYLRAYIANYNDRYDDALACVNRSLHLQKRLSSPSDQAAANCHFLRGLIFKRKGDFASALSSLTRALEIQTASKHALVAHRALTMMNIGAVKDEIGKYADAMQWYEEAMRLLRTNQEGESEFASNCYHYMSGSSRSLGEFDAAAEYEKRALSICERLYGHQHLAVSAALAQLADIYTLSGDYEPAREHYGEALAIMSRLLGPGHTSIAEIERKLARLALETNQLDSANALITRAASSKLKSLGPNHPAMGDIYEDMGDIARARKEFEAAAGHYQHAAAIKGRVKPSPPFLDLSAIFQKIGEVKSDQGRLEEATNALGRAESLQDSSRSRNPFLASAILRTLGDIQKKRGLIDEALETYDSSLKEISTDVQQVTALRRAGILAACGELHRMRSQRSGGRLEDLKAGVTCYDSAAGLLVRLRKSYQSSESKLFLQSEVLPVFNAGLSLCEELYRRTGEGKFVSMAFRFAELSKASVLAELMQEAKAKASGGVPDSLLDRECRLSAAIAAIETRLLLSSHAGDSTPIEALRHRLFTARRERNELQENLLADFPAYRNLIMKDNVATLDSVRNVLPPRTTLLSYAIADSSLYL